MTICPTDPTAAQHCLVNLAEFTLFLSVIVIVTTVLFLLTIAFLLTVVHY